MSDDRCIVERDGETVIGDHDWQPKAAVVTLDSRTGKFKRSRYVEQCAYCLETRDVTDEQQARLESEAPRLHIDQ